MNERYPIEAFAHSAHTCYQAGFAKLATLLLPEKAGVLYEPSSEGLRILAEHEDALEAAAKQLLEVFPDEIELGSPQPHLLFVDDEIREPVMTLTVTVPSEHLETILADLTGRGALVETTRRRQSECEMRAQVRLAAVIGYRRYLESMTHGAGTVSMRLSHYEAIPGKARIAHDRRASPLA